MFLSGGLYDSLDVPCPNSTCRNDNFYDNDNLDNLNDNDNDNLCDNDNLDNLSMIILMIMIILIIFQW